MIKAGPQIPWELPFATSKLRQFSPVVNGNFETATEHKYVNLTQKQDKNKKHMIVDKSDRLCVWTIKGCQATLQDFFQVCHIYMMCHRTFKSSLQQISLVLLTCLPAPLYFFNLLLSRLLFAEKWHASISSFFPWIYFFRVCLCICVCRDQSSLLVL